MLGSVCADLNRVLDISVNVRNRNHKRFKFGSNSSEDAVTWAVFSFMARARPEALRALGMRWLDADVTPTALIWGVPVPDQPRAAKIRDRLVSILDTIGETPGSRSEPDLILDYQEAGLVVIEVKLGSKNDENSNSFKMDRYFDLSEAITNIQEVKEISL